MARKKTKNYLDKKELLAEVILCKANENIMSNKLATQLQLLTANFAKSPQFAGYTFNKDMQAYAVMMLVRTWKAFNPEKSNNPFAYYTQSIKNSFIQYLNQEKKHRNIRDSMLVDQGLTPSYTFQMEYEQQLKSDLDSQVDDEEDYEQVQTASQALLKLKPEFTDEVK